MCKTKKNQQAQFLSNMGSEWHFFVNPKNQAAVEQI